MREEEEQVFPELKAQLSEDENHAVTMTMNKAGLKLARADERGVRRPALQPARVRDYSCANRCVAYSTYAHYMHCMRDTLEFMIADTSMLLPRSFAQSTPGTAITRAQ